MNIEEWILERYEEMKRRYMRLFRESYRKMNGRNPEEDFDFLKEGEEK